MAEMIGASPEELRSLGSAMRGGADRLDQIRNDLSAAFARTHWEGGDGEDVRADWSFRWSGMLRSCATAMHSAGGTLGKNAEQQEGTSAEDGGEEEHESLFVKMFDKAHEGFEVFEKTARHKIDLFEGIAGLNFEGDDWLNKGVRSFAEGSSTAATSMRDFFNGDGVGGVLKDGWQGVKNIHDMPYVRALSGDGVEEAASTALKAAGTFGSVVKFGLPSAGLVFAGGEFLMHPTVKGGVDTAFAGAELAAVECPPLAIALVGVQMGVDYLWDHPEVTHAIADGAKTAAGFVAHAATDEVKLGVDAVKTTGHIVSGGVKAVKHLFHW